MLAASIREVFVTGFVTGSFCGSRAHQLIIYGHSRGSGVEVFNGWWSSHVCRPVGQQRVVPADQ